MHIERNRHNNRRKNARGICRKHVPGSINIPLVEVEKRMKELDELPKPIIAYCHSGNRSGMAVAILRQYGISGSINGGGLDEMLQTKTY